MNKLIFTAFILSNMVFSQTPYISGTFDFKDTVEIGGGYKSIGYTNVLLIIKTKFGHTAAYAYDFGIPNGKSAVTRSGNEIFVKFRF